MRKKLLLQQIDSLQARVKHLEECIKTQDLLLEGYQNRESAVIRAMQKAQEDAEARLTEAAAKAQQIEEQAKQKSARLLAQTEATVAEYRDAIERYNAVLENVAAEAAESAERFARMARSKKLTEDSIVLETEGLSDIPYRKNVTLPDPEGDPARLIHNIYRLQNRILPDEVQQGMPDAEAPAENFGAPAKADSSSSADVQKCIDDIMEEDTELHTVSAVLESMGNATEEVQELSLDDLLDEIIKSGEQYHG